MQVSESPWPGLENRQVGQSRGQEERQPRPGHLHLAPWGLTASLRGQRGPGPGLQPPAQEAAQAGLRSQQDPDSTMCSEPGSRCQSLQTPAQGHRPGKTTPQRQHLPERDGAIQRLVKPEDGQIPSICKFRLFCLPPLQCSGFSGLSCEIKCCIHLFMLYVQC